MARSWPSPALDLSLHGLNVGDIGGRVLKNLLGIVVNFISNEIQAQRYVASMPRRP